jgi:hypothetical protein
MSKNLIYKITVSDGKKEVYSSNLSFNEVQDFISSADDTYLNQELFQIASEHPSDVVRENVAYKDSINQETYDNLAVDESLNVLRRLVGTEGCRRYASQEQLEGWIKLDPELARNIANSFDRYDEIDLDAISKLLCNHSDPSVVAEIASNSGTPKKYLKTLLKHSDSRVVANAKRSLE